MLQDKDATYACDMWALGCMIFQMLTGDSPFRTASEYLTFNVILAHCDGSEPLVFPDIINSDASDIIKLLLSPDPATRLGSGPEGTGGDFTALRNHPFFHCEDSPILWGHLLEQTAPHIPDPTTFPNTASMRDGADDEWLSDGEATPIAYNPIAYKKGQNPCRDSDDCPVSTEQGVRGSSGGYEKSISLDASTGLSRSTKSTDKGRYWDQYLTLGEEHVFGGIIWKRKVCKFTFTDL